MSEESRCAEAVRDTGDPPGETCLRLAAGDVTHDLDLLRIAWNEKGSKVGWTLWFVTARVVGDFFFRYERRARGDGSFPDDVLAADYLEPGAWKPIAEARDKPPAWGSVRTAANKLSAHLTYSRVDLRDAGGIPPSPEVHRFLLETADRWLDELDPERRAWFD